MVMAKMLTSIDALSGGRLICGVGVGWWKEDTSPIALARAISLRARCTTGGSIIFEPRLTTPSPFSCASS